MKNLTLRQIRIFLAAARHLNFSKAAAELHVTAPAVSLQLRQMEQEIGAPLFLRDGRRVALTAAGEYFLLYARRVIATLDDADDAMARLRGQDAMVLRIGLVSTAKYFVPKLLAQFRQAHPKTQIRIEVLNRQQLLALLGEGGVDIAIMGRPPQEISAAIDPFADHPHAFIASPSHPLSSQSVVTAAELGPYELITRESGSGTRHIMESFLAEHLVTPIVTMEMSSNESIKQAVMADFGLSFVSLHTIGEELKHRQLVVLPVQDTPILRTWHVVIPSRRSQARAAQDFRRFVLEKGDALLREMFHTAK